VTVCHTTWAAFAAMCDKSQEKFVIKSIVTFSRTRNRFLVSWEDYPPSSNTWEPLESFNDQNCPLNFLVKLKSLGAVCSECISVAKSSAPPPASVADYCNCIKRSPSPVGKPGKRALEMIAAPCNVSHVIQAATRGIQTQPLRRSLRRPVDRHSSATLQIRQEKHDIVHPSRPPSRSQSTPPPRTTTPRSTSQPRAHNSPRAPAAPCHPNPNPRRTRSTSAVSSVSSTVSALGKARPPPPGAGVNAAGKMQKGTRLVSADLPSPRQMSSRCAASRVTAPPTLRQLRLSHSIAQNLPSDPPAPRRMSPRRSASGGVRCRVSTPNDILDLEVRQEKGFPPRRWYLVSWFPCGSRPDSWVDCEDTPKHLVAFFEKHNPQHTANVDAEIKRRKGGRPPRPKTTTLAENVSQGRRDCTVYEAEDPKKKAYTRCNV
jgi:hypothetical protein